MMTGATSSATSPRRNPFRWLFENPVVLKELRGRMRGARAFIVLTVYLMLLSAFSLLLYFTISESSTSMSGQVMVGEIGRTLFAGIVAMEMLVVVFISPAFTSGAISGEREHRTFDLLRSTLLPSRSFVLGKLLSAILYVLLLLLAAIPLQSIAFFFGGVAETEVFLSFFILIMTALLFCTIGIYFSSRSARTLPASVLTYAVAMFIMFGLPIILLIVLLILNFSIDDVQATSTQVMLLYFTGVILSLNPVAVALITQYMLISQHTITLFSFTLANGETITLISPWIPFTIFYLILTVVFFLLTVRRVHKITQ